MNDTIQVTYEDYNYMTPLMYSLNKENVIKRRQMAQELGTEVDVIDKIYKLRWLFVKGGYDYDYGKIWLQENEKRTFELKGKKYESYGFQDYDAANEPSPTSHLTKLMQCTAFAAEVQLILSANGIWSFPKTETVYLFNKFTRKLSAVPHRFNMVDYTNNQCRTNFMRLDITKDIMVRDALDINADINYALLGTTK